MRPLVRIVNRSRGTVLGTRVALADSWLTRLRGYLGRPRPRQGEGLLLEPCDAIHTWGMSFPLDVVFLDPAGCVLGTRESLQPWTRPVRVRGARYVLEVPSGTLKATATDVGDALTWIPADPRPLQEAR